VDGAFVVQFLAGSDLGAGSVGGRVEHVASGRTARFACVDELLRFFSDLLATRASEES
jgi:hypothetical protein